MENNNTLELHKLLEQAENLRHENRHRAAVELYTAVLDQTDANTQVSEVRAIRLVALREIGLMQRRSGQHEAALASYEQYRVEAQDGRQQVVALTQLGQQYNSMGQQDLAMARHEEALQLAETLNYANGRALACLGIGSTHFYIGQYQEALTNLQQALTLFTQLKDVENLCRSWNWLGIVHMQLGSIDKSIHAYENALVLVREIGEKETAIVLDNLGESYQYLFDMEKALTYHRQGLNLLKDTDLPAQSIDIYRNMGVELCYLGQVEEGMSYLEQALSMSREYDQHSTVMQSLYSLALAKIQNGGLEEGKQYAEELLAITEARNLRGKQAQALYALGLYYQATGDFDQAQQAWQQVLFFAHDTGQHNLLWQVHSGLALISESKNLAQTHYRIAAEIIDQIVYPIEDKALRNKFLNALPIKAVLDQLN